MNFIKLFCVSLLVAICITATPSFAQKEVSIAAIVGDSAISTFDLQERIKIAIFAANLPKGKGFEEKLLPQVLRTMIDEKLYMKEAKDLEIDVSADEINKVLGDIEKRNGIQPGKFDEFMKFNGLSSAAMRDQIKSQLIWNKVIIKKIRPQITVSDKEVDEKIEHITKKSGVEEVNISEIRLPFDNKKDEKKVKDLADKLVKQLRQDGSFEKIAKQFSKGATADTGGDLGWVRTGQLPDVSASALHNMQTGEVSNPILLPDAYSILRLNDTRALMNSTHEDSQVGFKRAFVKADANDTDAERKNLDSSIGKKMEKLKTCDDFDNFAKDIHSVADKQKVTAKLNDLSPDISSKLVTLKANETTKITTSDGGITVLMLCERNNDTSPDVALKNKIRENMMLSKLETQANRYLRDLRRGAFIEIRI